MLTWLLAADAQAFTTRVHVALANQVISALEASGDGTLPLRLSGASVRLSEADARAIVEHPLEFRAGSIGPDNFVFPALTDQTHALGLRPYDQCADLLALAEREDERAYALGCFLHGASDAAAHHWVNWLTGETFTLNPISAGREESHDNVVRHIVAESMVQGALLAADPEVFAPEALYHHIPDAFVDRALVSRDSPAWQRMATHALPAFEAARAEDPEALLVETLAGLDLAPSELMVLLPVYLEVLGEELAGVGPALEERVAELQDHQSPDGATLWVTPGPDQALGTEDDGTDCDLTCPQLYAEYFVAIAMLEPRVDAAGAPLPPAWEEVTAELAGELQELPQAYLDTVGELSAVLTGPLEPGTSTSPDPVAVLAATRPLDDWLARLLDLQTDAAVEALYPRWLLDLAATLEALGVTLDLAGALESLLDPVLDEIGAAIRDQVLAVAEEELLLLLSEVEDQESSVDAEYRERLAAAAPTDLDGTVLDHLPDSGLWAAAFNLTAVTLAEPGVVLPTGDDWEGVGAASFDTSHTLAWTQAAACPELGAAVFPLGHDLAGLLSVRDADGDHRASVEGDSAVECHDGDLGSFTAAPDPRTCALTDLEALRADPVGSLSRGFPPAAVGVSIDCLGLLEPELPPEPLDPPSDPPAEATDDAGGGCGCATGGSPGPLLAWAGLLAALARRRGGAVALLAAACREDSTEDPGSTEPEPLPAPTSSSSSSPPGADDLLRAALGDTVWHGAREVDGLPRDVQVEFRAERGLWVEELAPWGVGRTRELRTLRIEPDGLTVRSVVTTPEGWPPSLEEGREDTWTFSLGAGALRLERGDGRVDDLVQGPVVAPSQGLTATARAFLEDSPVSRAFCDVDLGGVDHDTLFAFARGEDSTGLVAEDRVAGVPPGPWGTQPEESLAEVPGFLGTAADAPANYLIRYTGELDFPGGELSLRERDDSVEDGIWVLLGDDVGGLTEGLFLEVHGLLLPDLTPDEPRDTFPPGPLPVEILVARCDQPAVRIDLEASVDGAPFAPLADLPLLPDLGPEGFPPSF